MQCKDCSVPITDETREGLRCVPCFREARKAIDRAYREANREKRRARDRVRKAAIRADLTDEEKAARYAYEQKWRKANPEKTRAMRRRGTRKRRALKLVAITDGIDVSYQDESCTYCDSPAEAIDHVFPISVYADDRVTNKVPACQSCNSSKGALHPLAWLLRLAAEEA